MRGYSDRRRMRGNSERKVRGNEGEGDESEGDPEGIVSEGR